MRAPACLFLAEPLVRRKLGVHPHQVAVSSARTLAATLQHRSSEAASSQNNTVANVSPLVVTSGDSLQDVVKKNHRLRALLKTMRWPRLESFEVGGRVYELPCRQADLPACALGLSTSARLRYLAGFFDGDGCVGPSARCMLTVEQSVNQAGVLLLFLDLFGGSVRRQCDGVGLCRPVLKWEVCGQKACHAATLLAPYSITKQKQLHLVAAWPQYKKAQRQHIKEELQLLKKYDSAVVGHCTMEYFTGFFDAEGHIQQGCGGGKLKYFRLCVSQKYVTVLDCLKGFLVQRFSLDVRVRRDGPNFRLILGPTQVCKQVLHRMLATGLLCKAEQAKTAMSLTRANAAQVRATLEEHVGNQKFGKRLDEDGLRRAHEIQAFLNQVAYLKRRGEVHQAASKLQEVECLRSNHALLKARLENQQLHDYICKLHSLPNLPTSEPVIRMPRAEETCSSKLLANSTPTASGSSTIGVGIVSNGMHFGSLCNYTISVYLADSTYREWHNSFVAIEASLQRILHIL